ncbi:MAG: hemerythrin domain-containing protein [Proteobacteria bacterium]|nr:hemerythrin domain-containing protein [Pseudomonadota bacterium]
MATVSSFMQENHRECDELFAAAEEAVVDCDWEAAAVRWRDFSNALNHHITDREEGQLFPALEAVNGPMGPTMVMRGEHEQMRVLMTQLDEALAGKDQRHFLGLAETLMMLMQQHNMKEENILYPMMDQCIPNEAAKLS